MIKVLHYIPGFLYGGIESMFLSWYKNINPKEVEFELLLRTQDETAPALLEYKELGGVYYRLPSIKSGIKFYQAEADFFKNHHDYDILHVHGNDPFVMKLAKKNGIKTVVCHSHSASDGKTLKECFFYQMDKFLTKKYADQAFACSKLAAEYRFGGLSFKKQSVTIVRNAIDVQKFRFDESKRNSLRNQMALERKTVIGHIGRMTFPKNQFFLLDIFKSFIKKNKHSVLLMVGDGPDLEKLKAYAKELGIFDSVLFLGSRDDVPELLQAVDLILLPSRWEGLPVTLVEAQAAGLPCVISDVISDEVDVTDLIYRKSLQETPDQWASEMDAVLKGFARRDHGQEIEDSGFGIVNAVDALITEYTHILKK